MISNFKFQISNSGRGLTLVELVVVLAVFMFVVGGATTLFISIVQNQQRLLQNQNLINQASYVLDTLSRSIRTAVKDVDGSCLFEGETQYPGYYYLLTRRDVVNGYYTGLKFRNSIGNCEEVFLDSDAVFKKKQLGSKKIISDSFPLKYARFVINGDKNIQGASESDATQPRLTMVLSIQTKSSGATKEMVVQTTISQVNLNVQ